MRDDRAKDEMDREDPIEALQEEATAAKRSHGESEEFLADTEVNNGRGMPSED